MSALRSLCRGCLEGAFTVIWVVCVGPGGGSQASRLLKLRRTAGGCSEILPSLRGSSGSAKGAWDTRGILGAMSRYMGYKRHMWSDFISVTSDLQPRLQF